MPISPRPPSATNTSSALSRTSGLPSVISAPFAHRLGKTSPAAIALVARPAHGTRPRRRARYMCRDRFAAEPHITFAERARVRRANARGSRKSCPDPLPASAAAARGSSSAAAGVGRMPARSVSSLLRHLVGMGDEIEPDAEHHGAAVPASLPCFSSRMPASLAPDQHVVRPFEPKGAGSRPPRAAVNDSTTTPATKRELRPRRRAAQLDPIEEARKIPRRRRPGPPAPAAPGRLAPRQIQSGPASPAARAAIASALVESIVSRYWSR